MARDPIKVSNDKRGFRKIIAIVLLLLIWAVVATVSMWRAGDARYTVYGLICIFGIGYIALRSIRSYRVIAQKETDTETKEGEEQ